MFRPYEFVTCNNTNDGSLYPVSATIKHADSEESITVRGKYLFGCDGARSLVRKAIAGGGEGDGERTGAIRMEGSATDIVWGVMDVKVKSESRYLHSLFLLL